MASIPGIDFTGIAGTIVSLILWILGIILAGAIVGFIILVTSYKHRFRVKILTGGKIIEVDDKAKTVKKKDGTIYWKLMKRKDTVPVPPVDALNVTNKGKLSVTAYYTEHGEYVYLRDIRGLLKDEEGKKLRIGGEEPLTTVDREFYLNQVRRADAERGTKLSTVLLQLAPFLAIIIILVMVLSFWGTLSKPYTEATKNMQETSANFKAVAESISTSSKMLNEIILEKQNIPTTQETTGKPPG